jgi:hypothetical protein
VRQRDGHGLLEPGGGERHDRRGGQADL